MGPKKIVRANTKLKLSAWDVSRLMIKHRVGSVVFVEDGKKPVGIVTESDILRKYAA